MNIEPLIFAQKKTKQKKKSAFMCYISMQHYTTQMKRYDHIREWI
jgi:hypothetical protein